MVTRSAMIQQAAKDFLSPIVNDFSFPPPNTMASPASKLPVIIVPNREPTTNNDKLVASNDIPPKDPIWMR